MINSFRTLDFGFRIWKFPRLTKTLLSFSALGVIAGATLLLLDSCSTTPLTLTSAPDIPGALFVGDHSCAECHTNICRVFPGSAHARIRLEDPRAAGQTGCEPCHGPGSLHVSSGGGRGKFIVNPGKDPSACFECHRSTEAEFHLPQHHPVLEKKMNCAQCHDPHGRDILKPAGGLAMARVNDTCAQCHREQTRPFVFEHPAMREGCAACHNPHGSVNAKLLVQRDLNLCLRCHAQVQGPPQPGGNGVSPGGFWIGNWDHTAFIRMGTCWSSGCHTAVHGSNIDIRLRY
ncbi:MAG TPA: cytochrome c3 family protein [Candidatus Binatia bacterium]|jgi:predicted CXXCH cytochrome family protein|nr:cytochrome c3 family protein [Candidatus Binatia bacterium]